MHHPYQVVAAVPASPTTFLLSASGSTLISINLRDGTIASQWQADLPKTIQKAAKSSDTSQQGHPNKKRRIDDAGERPNIIKIVVTPHGKHVILVTAEDKAIRVFSISDDGRLMQLSIRSMPKRPSGIAFLEEGSLIICADKFGDVYSLPLLPTEAEDKAAREVARAGMKVVKGPTASETTVHSKANLRALGYQRKRAEEKKDIKTKEVLGFAHELLLGHVSMLTDILVAEHEPENSKKKRNYILTSDRDEHIRVSRGPPQSFVIERFLGGHKEFVSSLCLVCPELLVSGGGDDDLSVCYWMNGEIISKIALRPVVAKALGISDRPIAVTRLLLYSRIDEELRLLIACEGVPALFHCPVSGVPFPDCPVDFIPLQGNLLDAAMIDDNIVVVSLDNIHKPGSTTDVDESTKIVPRLHPLSLDPESANKIQLEHITHSLVEANELITEEWHEKALQALLYSTETLRKRRGDGEGDRDD